MIALVSKLHRDIFWEDLADFDKPKPGDQIQIALNNDEQIALDVTRDASGKLFFVANDCLTAGRMMGRESSVNGWQGMSLRHYLNNDFYALLPEELKAMIVPTKIVQVVRGQRIECEDKIFCLSKTQVFGRDHSDGDEWATEEPEDTQLEIFKSRKNRIKLRGINGGVSHWWLRSPHTIDSSAFSRVTQVGGHNYYFADYEYGVCFSFCIQS